tara:strand:- start:3122 stop:3655 length:534 start_codon:yes stop_codon:yes gene_type:complete
MTERQAAIEQIDSMIQNIEIAMLTTHAETGLLRSCPMISVCRHFDGDLWFFSHNDDPRMQDIQSHPRVGVAYACPAAKNYVSMCGEASIVKDRQKFETLWKDDLQSWFPEGVKTPGLILIRIRVDHAEYWDHKRITMKHLMNYAKSLVTGEPVDDVDHEEISWPRAVTPNKDEAVDP